MLHDDRYGDSFTDEERRESERRCGRAALVGFLLGCALLIVAGILNAMQ